MIIDLRWFTSKTFREICDLRSHVVRIRNEQRDVLGEKALTEISAALAKFDADLKAAQGSAQLKAAGDALELSASQWLQPYPNASTRENFKEFLVSGVMVLTVFCFFVQPMKIPSGSAQPTLYGNLASSLETPLPGRMARFVDWFRGVDYHEWIAQDNGRLETTPVTTVFRFIKQQTVIVGNDRYTFFFPPDQLDRELGSLQGRTIKKGDLVFRLRISSGDRLFVDRFTYNFRRPHRGETIVFTSADIDRFLRVYRGPGDSVLIPNTHYIKRLIALGGESVSIGNDRHVRINKQRLDASTPHFANVYTFSGPPKESIYSGHVNELVANQNNRAGLARLFPSENTEFVVRPKHYLAFGDNTMNSYDGRGWGDFPQEKVVGRALFVFWPLTSRLGPVIE
jgi:signal peptidase I